MLIFLKFKVLGKNFKSFAKSEKLFQNEKKNFNDQIGKHKTKLKKAEGSAKTVLIMKRPKIISLSR